MRKKNVSFVSADLNNSYHRCRTLFTVNLTHPTIHTHAVGPEADELRKAFAVKVAEFTQRPAAKTATAEAGQSSSAISSAATQEFSAARKALEERVLSGRLLPEDRPSSRQVRLFLSRAHVDTSVERQWLQEAVLPALQQWCWREYQLEFQMVDM